MRHAFLLLILIIASIGFPVRAAEYTSIGEFGDTLGLTNLENPRKQNDIPGIRTLDQHISFAWENDLYYQRDYYFTNGFQINIFHDKLKKSPINRILITTGKKKSGTTIQACSCDRRSLRRKIWPQIAFPSETIPTHLP